ncbi:hypothetical protein [Nocardioides sp. SYSU D00065]|uniref:hypothetical protein n=1 Tax=Nocardioides sp. SYSU D00065 TaxID=2817378 RepID=UPI001B32C0D8|nr:hypothetical protein [Nocardioides sp. SYSU D00065]
MDIEIDPTEVLRSASILETVAAGLEGGSAPAHPGNAGFLLSDAIGRFASQMQTTSDEATAGVRTTAANLDVSATLLRRADDDAGAVARSLWSRIG